MKLFIFQKVRNELIIINNKSVQLFYLIIMMNLLFHLVFVMNLLFHLFSKIVFHKLEYIRSLTWQLELSLAKSIIAQAWRGPMLLNIDSEDIALCRTSCYGVVRVVMIAPLYIRQFWCKLSLSILKLTILEHNPSRTSVHMSSFMCSKISHHNTLSATSCIV